MNGLSSAVSARRCGSRFGAALALVVSASLAPAQDGAATWSVSDLAGEVREGRLLGVVDGKLRMRAAGVEEELRLDLDELSTLRPTRVAAPEAAPDSESAASVWLRSGVLLRGTVAADAADRSSENRGSEDGGTEPAAKISLRPVLSDRPSEIAFVHVKALLMVPGEQADAGFTAALAAPQTTDDLLFAKDPRRGRITQLPVRIVGLRDDRLVVTFRDREQTVPLERIHGIVMGTDNGIAPAELPRPRAIVELNDGRELLGALRGADGNRLALGLAEGIEIPVRASQVRTVRIESSRVAWLDALEPARVEQTPAFERVRPWSRNAAPAGAGLLLDGVEHARGLCLVPRTVLGFDLEPGSFDVFEALLGIDDRAGPLGNAIVRIRLDGEIAWETSDLTADSPSRPLRIELGDARRLTLETDFGESYDLGDHCVFAAARLLRERDS